MASPSEDRQSVKRENRSAEIRPSEELTNSDTTTTTEVDTENEHQDVTTLPSPRPRKRTAEHIGGRLIKRRRVGRSDITTNTQTPARAVTPPLPSSSAAETSSQTEQSSESEATIPESHDSAPHLTFTATNLLEWKDIPYPGFPVRD